MRLILEGETVADQSASGQRAEEITRVLSLKQPQESFVFVGVSAPPVPSLLRISPRR